jgi:hypothetical protein
MKNNRELTAKQKKLIKIAKENEVAIATGGKTKTKTQMLREHGEYSDSQLNSPSVPFDAPEVKRQLEIFKENLNNKVQSAAMIQLDELNNVGKAKDAKLGENVAAVKALHSVHRLENNQSTGNIEVVIPKGIPEGFIKRVTKE